MRHTRFGIILATAIAGCADAASVGSPLGRSGGAVSFARDNPGLGDGEGVQSARGEVSTPSGAGRRMVTVDAARLPTGEVRGGYRIDITTTGAFFEVTASCVAIAGNGAWVAGHITATNSPAIVLGSVSYFYMFDNGKQHGGVSPDRASGARINDQAGQDEVFCRDNPTQLPILAGLDGDVRVK